MSSVNKNKLYLSLYDAFSKAYPFMQKNILQEKVNTFWNDWKYNKGDVSAIDAKIQELKKKCAKSKLALGQYWLKANEVKVKENIQPSCEKPSENVIEQIGNEGEFSIKIVPLNPCESSTTINQLNSSASSSTIVNSAAQIETGSSSKVFVKPAQEKLQKEISVLISDVLAMKKRKDSGLMSDEHEKEYKSKKMRLEECQKTIKRKESEMHRHRLARQQQKNKMSKACVDFPGLKKKLGIRDAANRPRLEDDQPYLLETILDLALHGSAAHERRRDEVFRTVRSLDDLNDKLTEHGYEISRSATYIRLLPRKSNSIEGKRHVKTVPVKLIRSSNDLHKQHSDSFFAMTTVRHIEELASLLGPNEVTYLSCDDKARIPIGITAAKSQAPLLMHLEYRIKLPDHDFVIAKRHKLVPSVYAFCEVKTNGGGDRSALSYSGPTYIAIRSGKHTSSTALSHACDIERIYENVNFHKYTHTTKDKELKKSKPVLISIVDGGPDENCRFKKVQDMHIHHFLKHDLDAVIVACNAPGRSAFNRVERRMAPLSKCLSGIVLPHDHFGTHLDNNCKTVDPDLEKDNFSYAGKALAEVWSELIIDGCITEAEYVDPENSEIRENTIMKKDLSWRDRHVIQSQYMLQILKCQDRKCCGEPRSSIFKFLPQNGLPFPLMLQQTVNGLELSPDHIQIQTYTSLFVTLSLKKEALDAALQTNSDNTPYDKFCPSVQTKISSRTCICGKYFSSIGSLRAHTTLKKSCKTVVPLIRPKKIIASKPNKKLVLLEYDNNEEDVEWVYDVDLDLCDDTFTEPEVDQNVNSIYDVETLLTPLWTEVEN